MSDYSKGLLPSNWYSVTITQAYRKSPAIVLCFTVNTGKYAYRNILMRVIDSNGGKEKIAKRIEEGGYLVDNNETEYYFSQFIGLQFSALVSRKIISNSMVNVILELQTPSEEAQYNVLKEKEDTHFFTRNDERDAPWN